MSWGPNSEQELTTLLSLAVSLQKGVPSKGGAGQPSDQPDSDDDDDDDQWADADGDDDMAVCRAALKADKRRGKLQMLLGGSAGRALFGSMAAMELTQKVGAWV